jgi:hypothetical protein
MSFWTWLKNSPIEEPLKEALLSTAGVTIDDDDADWRPLSGDAKRDLSPMTQRRMQDLAVYLWESNLLANRLIELPIAYILAEGVKLKAEDEVVQEIIDQFWQHPINCMNIKLVKKVRELALYGEQCWPAFVNGFSGAVRLGYLDPGLIETVVVDPDNGEQPIGVVTVKNKKGEAKRYRVIVNGAEEELFTQRTRQIRETFSDGECFYFCINDLSNGRRGRSDLLPQTDWLDSYDQFMFGELDRVQFLRAFMWDVTLAGANEDDVKQKAAQIRAPKPGSVRVHNDAESWKAESPNINAADTDTTAKLFRNHVLGGATIPEHWFGGAGDVNRATGEDMSGPTFKVMSLRQAYLGYMLVEVGKYVIRQWELAHNGQEPDLADPTYELCVHWPEMVAKDTTKYAAALQQVTAAVAQAIAQKLLSRKTGMNIIEAVAGRLGVSFDAEAELAAIDAERPGQDLQDKQDASRVREAKPGQDLQDKQDASRVLPVNPVKTDPPGEMTALLAKTAQPAIDALLETIQAMLDTADDLPDAMRKIAGLFPDMDVDDLADLLARAMLASHLAGMNDVAAGK